MATPRTVHSALLHFTRNGIMLEVIGVLLFAAVAVYIIRTVNERRGPRPAAPRDDDPSTWEDSEELRYGAHDEEEAWQDGASWENGEDYSPQPERPYIPELDDPDRR